MMIRRWQRPNYPYSEFFTKVSVLLNLLYKWLWSWLLRISCRIMRRWHSPMGMCMPRFRSDEWLQVIWGRLSVHELETRMIFRKFEKSSFRSMWSNMRSNVGSLWMRDSLCLLFFLYKGQKRKIKTRKLRRRNKSRKKIAMTGGTSQERTSQERNWGGTSQERKLQWPAAPQVGILGKIRVEITWANSRRDTTTMSILVEHTYPPVAPQLKFIETGQQKKAHHSF